jgi:hypothetical protein
MPVSPTQAYVVELRESVGSDVQLCSEGLLLYRVNTGALTDGQGPIEVIGGGAHLSDASKVAPCGSRYDASLRTHFVDPNLGLRIEILDANLGSSTVQVSRTERRDVH